MVVKLARDDLKKQAPKSFDDVRAAFENRSILKASRRDLEELLAVAACEKTDDAALRAQVHEMGQAMRQLIANKRGDALRRPSKLALFALLLMAFALIWSGAQAYYSRTAFASTNRSGQAVKDYSNPPELDFSENDFRTHLTILELARHAPTMRNGTLQAWWAGEQARQVLRLEAVAKRQILTGDYDGAVRSAKRADAIRSEIPALVDFERPPAR